MFEPGSFSLSKRLLSLAYKSTLFSTIGMTAGLAGTTTSNALLALRKRTDPNFESQNKPPPILLNAFVWSMHMGISSNFRYQVKTAPTATCVISIYFLYRICRHGT